MRPRVLNTASLPGIALLAAPAQQSDQAGSASDGSNSVAEQIVAGGVDLH